MSGYQAAIDYLSRLNGTSSPASAPAGRPSAPNSAAQAIDFATPLPEMSTTPETEEDTLSFPEEIDASFTPLNQSPPVDSEPPPPAQRNGYSDALAFLDRQAQAATQQAVAEATTPDDRLPIVTPELADALGVLDYRDPQEGQRRQQAAAIGEILNLPMFERVNLGAAPVNPDGTVTIRRAQAVSPEAQAAADEQMEIIRLAAAKNLNPPTPSFLEKIQQRWRLGREAASDDQLAYRALMGEVDWNQVKDQLDPSEQPQRGGNWFSEGFLGAVQMLPAMVDGIISGTSTGLQGAMAGGTAAAIAGQLGPQALAPEELLTVPAAAAAGYSAGQAAGSSTYWYKQGAGSMYHALRKEGIPHEIASNVSAGFGAPYAGIELAQVTKLVPGLKQTAAQAVAGSLKKRLATLATEKAGEYATQIGQETLQEANNITGEALAEWIAGVKPPPEKASAWDRIAGTIKESALSIPFLMAPKGVVDTVQTVRGPAQQSQTPPPAPMGTPSSPTAPPSSATQPAPAEVPQNFTPISDPAAPAQPAPAPQRLGQVRAPEIPIDQTALDETFGPAPAAVPALSFSTDAITPEQTALATDFSTRLTGQLRTQGILDTTSTLDLTPVNLDRVDAGAPLADFIDNFSRLTGTRIQFVKASDPTIFGGAVRSDDAQTIYLNADSQRPVASLIGHEFGHTLQYSNPALYKDLRRVVATYTDSYRTRARESAAAPIYRTGPATQRVRTQTAELTNNTLGDAFLDPEFWRSVQNENRPLLQKLWTSFNEWIDSLLTRQSQATWGTPQFATDLTALRRDLAKTIAPALRPPTRSFGNAQVTAKPGVIDLAIEAYHGTPHKVDRFSLDKIGTGEGAQAYGWGLYFAENNEVAKSYKAAGVNVSPRLKMVLDSHNGDIQKSINAIQQAIDGNHNGGKAVWSDALEEARSQRDGNIYTVELDVEPDGLLDWDKPLGEQSDKVQGILQKWADDPKLWESMKTWNAASFYGANLKDDAAKQKSEFLLRLGIPGIRYLDQGSRGSNSSIWQDGSQWAVTYADPAAGQSTTKRFATQAEAKAFDDSLERTYNYVVFDENLIKITAENGQPVSREIAFASEPNPRKFTQSVQAAPGVAPEVKAQLTALDYDPISNAQTLATARARIDAAGSIENAYNGLMGKTAIEGWQPSAEDYATGMELMAQLQNRGQFEDAAAIANMMAPRATDQGRAIQQLSLISRLGPQGIELFAQKQLQNAAVNGRNEKEKAQIQAKLDEAAQLRVEMGKVRHGATTSAIVGRRAEIKSALPAGADPVATNMAIRDAIMAAPTPLAAEAATASILTGQGVSETGAARISKSIVRDFLKTSQDARSKVLQNLQAVADRDRRLNKGKLGDLLRLNREGKLADSGLHAGMAKMLGIPHWSAEHSAKVQRIIKERERATDPRIKLVKGAEILDVVYREFMPPGIASKIDTVQTIMMLLNPKTIWRNVLGNTFAFAADLAADAAAMPMDALVSLGTGQRTRVGISLGEGLKGLGAGFADVKAGYDFARSEGRRVMPSLAEGVNTLVRLGRLQSSGKYDSAEINRYSGGVFSMPGLRHLETTLGTVLSIADRGFYESAFRRSLDNRMKASRANGAPMLAPDKDMVDAARMDAARAIYQNETATGELLSKIRKALNYFSSFGRTTRWGLGSMIFKFTTTPSSILHRALDFSPIGFIKSSYELLAPMLSNNKEFDQKAFVDAFSQALVGTTGLVALGYWLSHLGIISAGSSADDEKKRNLEKARGWGNYKINVDALKRALMTGNFWTRQLQYLNDRTETYDWAQPLSIAVAMGAYARENQTAVRDGLLRGKKQNIFDTSIEWLTAAGGAATGAMNSLMEQPLLSGLNTFFKNASYDGLPGAIMETAVAIPGSFIPTAARQWMQLTDNSVRETRDSSPYREYINQLKAQLPGLSKTLPQKYDIAGQPVERWAKDSNTVFNVLFNPGMTTYIKGSPALTEMSRVFEMTANPGAVPNQVSRDFTLDGVKVRLTDEEISALQKDMGALSVAAIEKYVLADPRYANASWDIKAKAFTRALEKAAEAAKYRVLLSRPDLKARAEIQHKQMLQNRAAEMSAREQELATALSN